MTLRSITPREASIFACVVDAFCDPDEGLPEVRNTSAVAFLDDWLARAPGLNRLGFRVLLYAAEVGPVIAGEGARLRRLDRHARQRYLERIIDSPAMPLQAVAQLLRMTSGMGYYGDTAVMQAIGYDPEAKLREARELRAREGRP